MKRLLSSILAIALACALMFGAIPAAHAAVVEVTIPHYKSGENVGAQYFLPMVERFNAEFEGRFKVTIEEIVQDMYKDKIKQLGQQNMLPVVIEGGIDADWFYDVIVANNLFYDLKDFVDAHPNIKAFFHPDNYAYNTTADGKLATLPTPFVFQMTMYYNSAVWTPSRSINDMSWADVAADLGDAKIAFMTAENAWTTMLSLSSMIAAQPGGAELLNTSIRAEDRIRDFSHPALVAAFAELQTILQNHATANTIGAAYADAANIFMNNGAAIIANGSWMIGDFGPDSADKWGEGFNPDTVHAAVLPGNVALANPIGEGWWIPSNLPAEQIELGLAFLEFMNRPEELEAQMLLFGGSIPGFEHSEAYLAALAENRLMYEYMTAPDANTIIVRTFSDAIVPSVADPEFGKLLPKLMDGSLTPEAFAAELTKKAAETALD